MLERWSRTVQLLWWSIAGAWCARCYRHGHEWSSGHIISIGLHELGPVIMCTGKCTMYFDINMHVDASAVCVHDSLLLVQFYSLVLVWAELAHSLLLMQWCRDWRRKMISTSTNLWLRWGPNELSWFRTWYKHRLSWQTRWSINAYNVIIVYAFISLHMWMHAS